jgi:hypothetical protein
MEQNQFNKIQGNFRRFLSEIKNPSVKKQPITEQIAPATPNKIKMEKTSIFGQDDAEIGCKVISTDSNGNQTYRIVPPS